MPLAGGFFASGGRFFASGGQGPLPLHPRYLDLHWALAWCAAAQRLIVFRGQVGIRGGMVIGCGRWQSVSPHRAASLKRKFWREAVKAKAHCSA